MAWISQETIEAVKANFIVVGLIAVCYVVIYQNKQIDELHKEKSASDEQRKKELREDILFWQSAYLKTAPNNTRTDTIFVPYTTRPK